jgi:hypothetical protein
VLRAALSDEHFPAAVRDAFAQGGRRSTVDGTVRRYAALTAAFPSLLRRVSLRVKEELVNCLWNSMVTVAEDVTKAVESVCNASKLVQRPGDDAGAGPSAAAGAAGAAEAGAAEAGAMAQLAHAAAMSSAAEAVRRKPGGGEELRATVQAKAAELLQLLNEANIPYDVSILGDAAAASQPVRTCTRPLARLHGGCAVAAACCALLTCVFALCSCVRALSRAAARWARAQPAVGGHGDGAAAQQRATGGDGRGGCARALR